MNASDFDIKGLATYLHLTVDQVLKLANRGKIPARKIAGQWRFAAAEVHHWLEERIGISGDEDLAKVEMVLRKESSTQDDGVGELIPALATEIPLQARTQSSVIYRMVELAESSGLLWDSAKMKEAVKSRESLHPTALDSGVALLHPRRPMSSILAEPFVAFGRTSQGIPFGGGSLTDVFFLICSTDERGHLKTLARLSRLLAADGFISQLRELANWEQLQELLKTQEEALAS